MVLLNLKRHREFAAHLVDHYMEYGYEPEPGVPGVGTPQWRRARKFLLDFFLRHLEANKMLAYGPKPSRREVHAELESRGVKREVVQAGLRVMLLTGPEEALVGTVPELVIVFKEAFDLW